MSKKYKINFSSITIAVIANLFVAGVLFVSANWQAPASSPPTCNSGDPGCDAPVNVGPSTQVKAGAFGVGGLFRAPTISSQQVVVRDWQSPTSTETVMYENGDVKVGRNLEVRGDLNLRWQKFCRAYGAGAGIPVWTSWTLRDCKNYSKSIGATSYRLACYFPNGTYSQGRLLSIYSIAVYGDRFPNPNCGWTD